MATNIQKCANKHKQIKTIYLDVLFSMTPSDITQISHVTNFVYTYVFKVFNSTSFLVLRQ